MTKKKAVAKRKSGEVATTHNYGDHAGKGFQNQTQADIAMPFLNLLQAMSPEIDDVPGAKAGMIGPDDTTFAYLENRPHAPTGADWEAALDYWRSLTTDSDATFERNVTLSGADISERTIMHTIAETDG